MKPIFPISNMATFLFRKGTTATEKDFEPDGELMQEMMNRKIRVQDLVQSLHRYADKLPVEIDNFVYWAIHREAGRQDAQHEQDLKLEMEMFLGDK